MQESLDGQVDELVWLAGERAVNLYGKHKLCCSESVLVVMNEGFGGTLPRVAALQIGAGFCRGIGGAGCVCGALSGAVAGLGLFFGPHAKEGVEKKRFKEIVKEMHDLFRQRFRATCCRVLTKKVKHDRKAHKESCQRLTRGGVEIGVRLLLTERPALIEQADINFLQSKDPVT